MGLHPLVFSILPFHFHLHATWSSGSWALILRDHHCMVSRKFDLDHGHFCIGLYYNMAKTSLIGGDFQESFILISRWASFSFPLIPFLRRFIISPVTILFLRFLSLRRSFFPLSVQAVALMVFQLGRRYPALASGRMVVSYCNLPFDDDMSPSFSLFFLFFFFPTDSPFSFIFDLI